MSVTINDEAPQGPLYCPGCGQQLGGGDKVLFEDSLWDCHCPICDWAGEIIPDGLLE